ncbi:DUF4124 domain-containing protein [Hahella aquimaris]|uniref:DUF4124 domain-containing protein n=1 Tax=Hahella sp. HNIBRBA332 TaxID=3015983 RepID=UPI00273BCF1D|nr:DUF4124 domain-containing protein [Hahella sp. HNIBRBA332]WLQ13930.1 DUF4124 domain-containing protein [Hahella sp. HNIBRBA332]
MARISMADSGESGLCWKRAAQIGALCFTVLYSGLGYGQIYKCVNAKGKVAFQETPCSGASAQTEVEVRAAPTPAAVEEAKQIHNRMRLENEFVDDVPVTVSPIENEAIQAQKEDIRAKCENLKNKILEEEKNVITDCKRRRDIFCDLPPEEIIITRESNSIKTSDDYNHYLQHATLPPLFLYKQAAKHLGCQL